LSWGDTDVPDVKLRQLTSMHAPQHLQLDSCGLSPELGSAAVALCEGFANDYGDEMVSYDICIKQCGSQVGWLVDGVFVQKVSFWDRHVCQLGVHADAGAAHIF
jgi:hypothetical protein